MQVSKPFIALTTGRLESQLDKNSFLFQALLISQSGGSRSAAATINPLFIALPESPTSEAAEAR